MDSRLKCAGMTKGKRAVMPVQAGVQKERKEPQMERAKSAWPEVPQVTWAESLGLHLSL